MCSMLSEAPVECPQSLLTRAQHHPRVSTAVVGAAGKLPLESARLAQQNGLIEPVLVGDPNAISACAKEIGWEISALRIVAAGDEVEAAATAVSLARSGEVQSLMKGDLHTDHLLRAVLNRDTGLRTDRRLSHVFHMTLPGSDEALCITDGAINVAPSLQDKINIALNAIDLLHALGNAEPRIALLSATEQETATMPSSVDAAELVRRAAAGEIPGALVDGPFAFDNAVSVEAARVKGITSPVAGHADVLLVPNIETGNALFKQMVYFMSAAAAGIVLGATVPITLTSRADPPAARLASAALAAIYANRKA